ncbi:uncharacterized protein LOC127878630 [Dreissena polymorpha]|uniref:uncharacterized protein LOC127878630 n=1 Tax=Dreissena polymorpha TaxID=45954 RepID=UPI002263FECB|nr:uncharacterized protein LOC127878630 [Dreissena polymorpha]
MTNVTGVAKNHEIGKCPAYGATCHYCKKENHWFKVCTLRRNNVNKIKSQEYAYSSTEEESNDEELFHIRTASEIDESVNAVDDKWLVKLDVCDSKITLRIDTGAKFNILVEAEYDKIMNNVQLHRSSKPMKSYTNHQIKPLGSNFVSVKSGDKVISTRFEVVNLSQENILSGNMAEELGLVQEINNIDEQIKKYIGL